MKVTNRWWIAVLASVVVVAMVPSLALADWNPGDPFKWRQEPDLTPTGMDVNATFWNLPQPQFPYQKILADDWLCTSPDPVTDIHIWGSWLNDRIPDQDGNGLPDDVLIKLSIHDDIAAGVGGIPYSRPGPLRFMRVFQPGQYRVRRYPPTVPPQPPVFVDEQFYEPNSDPRYRVTPGTPCDQIPREPNPIIGKDTIVWQYNFVNITNPFIQEGTPTSPRIYWLDVQVLTPQGFVFGWKTSLNHNLDDAVFGDTPGFGAEPTPQPFPPFPPQPWKDLRYPCGHKLIGTIDLAFVITSPSNIPTVSEWGLIIMTLLLLTAGTIILARRRVVLAGAGGGSVDTSMAPDMPLFAPSVFATALVGTLALVGIGFAVAFRLNDELATRDIIGSLISAPIFAYMVHLWIQLGRKNKNDS